MNEKDFRRAQKLSNQANCDRNSVEHTRARADTESFISEISLSMSCRNWMIKSTSLCLYMVSVWKFVTRKLMSNVYRGRGEGKRNEHTAGRARDRRGTKYRDGREAQDGISWERKHTGSAGFRRRMTKFSARWVRKRVNILQRMVSSSSA